MLLLISVSRAVYKQQCDSNVVFYRRTGTNANSAFPLVYPYTEVLPRSMRSSQDTHNRPGHDAVHTRALATRCQTCTATCSPAARTILVRDTRVTRFARYRNPKTRSNIDHHILVDVIGLTLTAVVIAAFCLRGEVAALRQRLQHVQCHRTQQTTNE